MVNEKTPTDNDDETEVAIDDGWRVKTTEDLGSLGY
jgi:hypothetical protein